MTVEVSTPEGLIVSGSTLMSALGIGCGIMLIAVGMIYWSDVLEAQGSSPRNHQPVNVKMRSLPLIGLFAVGYGINQWARRIYVDGPRKSVHRRGLLGARSISGDQLAAVFVRVLPCSISKYEAIEVGLVDRRTRGTEVVVKLLTGSCDISNVALLAEELARLLDVPLVVVGMSRYVPEKLAIWLARNQTHKPVAGRAN